MKIKEKDIKKIGEELANINLQIFYKMKKYLINKKHITYRDVQYILFKNKTTITIKEALQNANYFIQKYNLDMQLKNIDNNFLNCRIGLNPQKRFDKTEQIINSEYLIKLVKKN